MDMNWSFRLARMFGTEVRVHWTLPMMLLFYVLREARDGWLQFVVLFVAVRWIGLFASVLAHEFGHIFAARAFRLPANRILLWPLGGLAFVGQARTPRAEFIIAFAGPLVNLGLGALALLPYWWLGGPVAADLFIPFSSGASFGEAYVRGKHLALLWDFIATQNMMFLFNVLCIAYPMDGGRMLAALLWTRMGYGRAHYVSCTVAKFLAVVLAVIFIAIGHPVMVLLSVFIFIQAHQTQKVLPYTSEPGWATDDGGDPRYEALWQSQQEDLRPRRKKRRWRPLGWFSDWRRRRRESRIRDTRERVDVLLDKISRDGIGSLTDEEKAYLKAASRQYQMEDSEHRSR